MIALYLAAHALHEPAQDRFALRDLIERYKLVRFVRLLDAARATDYRGNPGLLE